MNYETLIQAYLLFKNKTSNTVFEFSKSKLHLKSKVIIG